MSNDVNINHPPANNKRRNQTPEQLAAECIAEAERRYPGSPSLINHASTLAGKRARGAKLRRANALIGDILHSRKTKS